MWTARLGPYSVGVVRWRSPRPSLTVVVKTTLALDSDGPMRPSPVQLDLSVDHRGSGTSDDELEHASDFVPRKAQADLIVVGNARSEAATTAIPVAFELGAIVKRFVACAGSATRFIPLASTHLRQGSESTRTAPHAMRVPEWSGRALREGFDYSLFNVAPPDQRTGWLEPGARLVLEGLWPCAQPRDARVPDLRPSVHYLPLGVEQGRAREIAVFADTLWIHADRQICTICWRGVLERVPAQSQAEQLVVMPAAQCPGGWADVARQIGGAVWVTALQEQDLRGPPRERAIDAPVPQADPMGMAGPSARSPAPSGGDDEDDPATYVRPASLPDPSPDEVEEEPAPVTPRAGLSLGGGLGSALGGVVLFSQKPGASALPYRATASPTPGHGGEGRAASTDDTTLAGGQMAPPESSALPFVSPGASVSASVAPQSATGNPIPAANPPSRSATTGTEPPPAPSTGGLPTPRRRSAKNLATQTMEASVTPAPSVTALPFREPSPNQARPPSAAPLRPPPATGRPGRGTMVVDMRGLLESKQSALPTGWRDAPASTQSAQNHGDPLPFAHAPPPQGAQLPLGPATQPPAAMPSRPATVPSPPPPLGSGPAWLAVPAPSRSPLPPTPEMTRPPAPEMTLPPAPEMTLPPAPEMTSHREIVPPQHTSPVAFSEVSSIPIATYTAVKAALWQPGQSVADVLATHDIDEARWHANERRVEQALEREAAAGGSQLSSAIRAALVRSTKEPADVAAPEMTLDEYATLRAEVDAAEDASIPLEAGGLSQAEWQRLRRHWHRKALEDPDLAERLRAAIAKARREERARSLSPKEPSG